MPRMQALRTFSGLEGFIKRGQQFDVQGWERAKQLSQSGLAKVSDEAPAETQEPTPVPTAPEAPAEETPVADSPSPAPAAETWGITTAGGGLYVLPNGEKVEGMEKAKERLFQLLSAEFVKPETAKVKLIQPVAGPKIIWTDDTVPVEGDVPAEETPTGEETPTAEEPTENEEEPPPEGDLDALFEQEVKYIGGGWYELPNKERVQGKESARDLWEIYRKGRD